MKQVMAFVALVVMVMTASPAVAGITVSVTAPSPASGTVPVTVTTISTKALKELRVLIDGVVVVALTCPAPAVSCVASWDTTAVVDGADNVQGERVTVHMRVLSSATLTLQVIDAPPPAPTPPPPAPSTTPPSGTLLQPGNLVYIGAFRVPGGSIPGSQPGQMTFAYGGTSLGFNPVNQSLFLVGHDWDQQVAEIQIPATIVSSPTIAGLPTATVLQPLADVTEGQMRSILASPTETVKVGGLFVANEQLIVSVYDYYDGCACNAQSSHFVSGLTLATPGDLHGPFRVGDVKPGFVSGYMTAVPAEWQAALGGTALTGNCCLSIIGRTSFGPAVFAFTPPDLGTVLPVPATELVAYPETHPTLGAWDATWNGTTVLFNATTQVRGAVLPTGTRSLLFFGSQGTGPFCYGVGVTTTPGLNECFDPVDSSKGTHAYPYVYQVWAYDVADLAAVKAGQKLPWDVRPYAVWTLALPYVADGSAHLGGAAYDPATGRIYVSQQYVDRVGFDPLPVIHVFQIAGP